MNRYDFLLPSSYTHLDDTLPPNKALIKRWLPKYAAVYLAFLSPPAAFKILLLPLIAKYYRVLTNIEAKFCRF